MIIHSVTPLQMLSAQDPIQPQSMRRISGGYLEGYDTPEGFQATRLMSTDPSLYLKNEYSPGSILPPADLGYGAPPQTPLKGLVP